MYRNIICQSCGKISQISNIQKYLGKKVRLNCLNTACNKEIILDLTNDVQDDTTFVVKNIQNYKTSGTLSHTDEEGKTREYVLIKDDNVVGRKSESTSNDIGIKDDPYISRRQFIIKTKVDAKHPDRCDFTIADCESKNKTYLNGKELKSGEEIFLIHNDVIKAGKSTFIFKNES
jgi:pSer/pThr/pTyr-binding forkhead associated (FHA) protein